jgi:hypothetical protein
MADIPESLFQNDLMDNEKIHWTGQPDPSIIFSGSDIFMIPFSLLWGGFALFWEGSVLGWIPYAGQRANHAPLFFALWSLPFVGMGLYMIFGRFFFKVWLKKRTYYAITNKRVLIITQGFRRQVQAVFFSQIPVINKSVRGDGTGSLVFGNAGFGTNYANTGMDFLGSRYNRASPGFFDIHDADMVYQMAVGLQNQIGA